MSEDKPKIIARDISWLSFNARVLQEAADTTVPLRERIRFLGIFSNNMDEFFRVRVATLKRMIQFGNKANMHLETNPQQILDDIQMIVLSQQSEFARIWEDVQAEMKEQRIFLVTEKELDTEQQEFVRNYFDNEVSPNIIPLMIENIPQFPNLRDKSIYLAIVMWKKESAFKKKYALIEIPSRILGRFVLLPSNPDEHHIILLEDIVRFNLPEIFSYFGYDQYNAHVFKVTRDAELEIDNDLSTNIIQKIEKGLKNRRKGKPVRFVYDKEIDPGLLEYLTRRLNLSRRDNLIPGGRIHNFRHFMDFPDQVFKPNKDARKKPFDHPMLTEHRVSDVVLQKDIMLHFPYHSFTPLIDIIREAAFDPDVTAIKITCYRLATQSRIINALINAVRNGKEVVVMLELRARFDEEANLEWKTILEEEGAKVLVGMPNMKVHSKLCMIRKKIKDKNILYGFVSTGNLNEKTARVYGDHCLLTSNARIMTDISRMFNYLEHYKSGSHSLKSCTTIIPSPHILRREMYKLIDEEIRQAKKNKPSGLTLKMNSLSDEGMIAKLNEAARAGVPIRLIIRGINCMLTENKKFKRPVRAISIVDEYLEHARVWVFHNRGKEKVYISSADWMLRNLEHRVEATCPILDEGLKQELIDILNIQLQDNVKARWLDNDLSNEYIRTTKKKVRSQVETYNYLSKKTLTHSETGSH
jgi:polyphosphate kinase